MSFADVVHPLVVDGWGVVSAEIDGKLAVATFVAKEFHGAVDLHKGNNVCITREFFVPGSMGLASVATLGILMAEPGRFALQS